MRYVYNCYRFAHVLHRVGVPVIPRLITYVMRFVFSCWIPAQASIGAGTIISYGGLGTVIHSWAVIGRDCVIGQGVTIGGGRGAGLGSTTTRVPRLGDRVRVGSGAKIIGAVTIGDDATVGANAVVTKDVAAGSVVVGVPARVIESRHTRREAVIDE